MPRPQRLPHVVPLLGRAAWRALARFSSGHDLTYAASVAYWALLSLFPFLLLVFSIVGAAAADDADRQAVVEFALSYFPAQVDLITRQIDAVRAASLRTGVAGLAGLAWASLGFFGSVTAAVNHAWGVETPRSFLKHRLVVFLMLVAAGLLFVVAVMLTSAVQILEASWFARVLSRFPGLDLLRGLGVQTLSLLLLIGVLGLVYYFVPNAKVRFRDVWLGAVVTGVIWRLVFAGFSWYVTNVSVSLNRIHGSVGVVVVFLLWVYVSAVVVLYGAELTAAYDRLRNGAE